MTAVAARDSTLVTVTVEDGDPQRAADLANAIAAQLIAASDTVFGTNGRVQGFIDVQIEETQVQIEETQAEIDRLTALPSRTLEQDQELAALKGQVAGLRQALRRARPALGSVRATPSRWWIPPRRRHAPSSPRVLLNTLIAALVGLLLALGIAYTLEYLDDTVKSSADVEATTGLPTLGDHRQDEGREGPQRDLPPRHRALPAWRRPRRPTGPCGRTSSSPPSTSRSGRCS